VIRVLLVALLVAVLFGWAAFPMSKAGLRRLKRLAFGGLLAAGVFLLLRAGLIMFAVSGLASLLVARFVMPALFRILPVGRANNSGSFSSRASPNVPTGRGMTRAHALEVLNLKENATREEITASYRELIRKVHPDRGGSSYLAAEVNQARDVLLG